MPEWLRYALIVGVCGLLYHLLSQTFRKIITNIHQTQTKVDEVLWEVRGRGDLTAQHLTLLEGQLAALQAESAKGASSGCRYPSDEGAHRAYVPLSMARVASLQAVETPLDDARIAEMERSLSGLRLLEASAASPNGVTSRDDSLARLASRSLLVAPDPAFPPHAFDGKTVLLYGVGNGNDLVALCESSRPARVVVVDRAAVRLADARKRLRFHDVAAADFVLTPDGDEQWLRDASFDFIHCTGTLHWFDDPLDLLTRFRKALRADGELRYALLNEDSVWMNLYVAYLRRTRQHIDATLPLREAFVRSLMDGALMADGETTGRICASACLSADGLAEAAARCGLEVRGSNVVSTWLEMTLLEHRQEAITSGRLSARQASFLRHVTVDAAGCLVHQGRPAGLLSLYRLCPVADDLF